MHTNRVRVILGGLLAGLVINMVEFITNGVVLREAWGQVMQVLGKPAQLSAGAIVIFNIWGFLVGIAAVWLYAAKLSLGPFPHPVAGDHVYRGARRDRSCNTGGSLAI
jgi:hypothetical protein